MSTIREIIIDAYRESGIVATGEEPDADQLDEALRRINVLYDSLFGNELGENLVVVNYGRNNITNSFGISEDISSEIDSTFIPTNLRLMLNIGEAGTLYLDPNPRDGARLGVIDSSGNLATYNLTINGNGRKIESAVSVTLNTNGLNREWFYRADLGNWTRVTDLLVGDTSPLPSEFDDLLSTMLAIRLNPRHGAETSNEMLETLKRARKMFRARYSQVTEQDSEMGLYRLPSTKFFWRRNNFNG